jgi:PAS domain-containing protein
MSLEPATSVGNSPAASRSVLSGLFTMSQHSATDVPLATFDAARSDLADVLEYTHDAIIIWELKGVAILYWNRAAEHLYGHSRQEALGRSPHVLLQTQIEGRRRSARSQARATACGLAR